MNLNRKTLKINGGDPRRSRAFLTLSQVMNFPDRLAAPGLDWQRLEKDYHHHYRGYGYDLQSGCWFCLIGLQRYGWQGLAQALSLLTSVWNGQGCWPGEADEAMRRYLLEWFNSNVVTRLYTLKNDAGQSEVQQVARAIACLQAEAEKTGARCRHSFKNARYFLQVRSQPESSSALCYPVRETVAVEEPPIAASEASPQPAPFNGRFALVWFGAGVLATLLGAGCINLATSPTLSERLLNPLAAFMHYESTARKLWHEASEKRLAAEKTALLQEADALLHWIASRPENELLRQGEALAQRLAQRWPDNEASGRWRHLLQTKADTLTTDSYGKTLARLDDFDALLRATEQKKGSYLTVSELKSIAWQLRRELERGGPPAAQLLDGEAPAPAQLKQAQEHIAALNALYLLKSTGSE